MASWKILHLRMYLLMWIFQLAMLVFGRVSVFVQLLYGSGKYIYLYYDLGAGPRPYSRGKGASYQSFLQWWDVARGAAVANSSSSSL